MEPFNLFGAEIEFDLASTAAGYSLLERPDPSCCDACAEFRELASRNMLPSEFAEALRRVGIDPAKPQEVYGDTEGGFLAGWYIFVGILQTSWRGEAKRAFAEIEPGFRCWVTEHVAVLSWPRSSEPTSFVQVEFDWQGRVSSAH